MDRYLGVNTKCKHFCFINIYNTHIKEFAVEEALKNQKGKMT